MTSPIVQVLLGSVVGSRTRFTVHRLTHTLDLDTGPSAFSFAIREITEFIVDTVTGSDVTFGCHICVRMRTIITQANAAFFGGELTSTEK